MHLLDVGTQICDFKRKTSKNCIRTIKTLEVKQSLQVMSTRILSKLMFFSFKMKICLSRTHMNTPVQHFIQINTIFIISLLILFIIGSRNIKVCAKYMNNRRKHKHAMEFNVFFRSENQETIEWYWWILKITAPAHNKYY